jgi:hypothetical protein
MPFRPPQDTVTFCSSSPLLGLYYLLKAGQERLAQRVFELL